jgi:hypothetical protein
MDNKAAPAELHAAETARTDHLVLNSQPSAPDAIFVDKASAFDDSRRGKYFLAANAPDLAKVIGGASVFVGIQSLPSALAEG